MTKPSNIDSIVQTTRLTWDEWVAHLDGQGARDLPHRAIADLAYEKLKDSLDNAGWWSQSVAVAYEQHIGRRDPGQRSDGTYEAAVSKTLDASLDKAMQTWLKLVQDQSDFDNVTMLGEPTATKPKSGRHWAVNLTDGSRLNADCYPKSDTKTILTVTHAKLPSKDVADRWKNYWKDMLAHIES